MTLYEYLLCGLILVGRSFIGTYGHRVLKDKQVVLFQLHSQRFGGGNPHRSTENEWALHAQRELEVLRRADVQHQAWHGLHAN